MNKYKIRAVVEFSVYAYEGADAVELISETLEDYNFTDFHLVRFEVTHIEEE